MSIQKYGSGEITVTEAPFEAPYKDVTATTTGWTQEDQEGLTDELESERIPEDAS